MRAHTIASPARVSPSPRRRVPAGRRGRELRPPGEQRCDSLPQAPRRALYGRGGRRRAESVLRVFRGEAAGWWRGRNRGYGPLPPQRGVLRGVRREERLDVGKETGRGTSEELWTGCARPRPRLCARNVIVLLLSIHLTTSRTILRVAGSRTTKREARRQRRRRDRNRCRSAAASRCPRSRPRRGVDQRHDGKQRVGPRV